MRCALVFLTLAAFAQAQESGLSITVIDGQDAVNNINQPGAHEPVIEVRNARQEPVAGAAVVFQMPSQGAGGTFANGTGTLTVSTDRNGRAIARGMHLNHVEGKFEIRISASYQGQIASAIISQTNVAGISTSARGPSRKIWVIVALAGGAAAAGVLAATRGGSGGGMSNAPIVITPGTPTVGGPH